jgi:hypothetical protein
VAAFCFAPRSPLFEIARVLVRLDQVARVIVNANHGIMCVKSVTIRSTCSALQKLVQRTRDCEDRPDRNRDYDGEKQRFDHKFTTLFPREVAPAQLTE